MVEGCFMNREEAELLFTDMLAGEISAEELDRLEEYAEGNAEFREFRDNMELLWGLKESFSGEKIIPEMSEELQEKIKEESVREQQRKKVIPLSFDILDSLAAAGTDIQLLKRSELENDKNKIR